MGWPEIQRAIDRLLFRYIRQVTMKIRTFHDVKDAVAAVRLLGTRGIDAFLAETVPADPRFPSPTPFAIEVPDDEADAAQAVLDREESLRGGKVIGFFLGGVIGTCFLVVPMVAQFLMRRESVRIEWEALGIAFAMGALFLSRCRFLGIR